MKFTKRPIAVEEQKIVAQAMWDFLYPWDLEDLTIEDFIEDVKSREYGIWIENAETKEPLFVIIGPTEDMTHDPIQREHQEVFEWVDGNLQRFDLYPRRGM